MSVFTCLTIRWSPCLAGDVRLSRCLSSPVSLHLSPVFPSCVSLSQFIGLPVWLVMSSSWGVCLHVSPNSCVSRLAGGVRLDVCLHLSPSLAGGVRLFGCLSSLVSLHLAGGTRLSRWLVSQLICCGVRLVVSGSLDVCLRLSPNSCVSHGQLHLSPFISLRLAGGVCLSGCLSSLVLHVSPCLPGGVWLCGCPSSPSQIIHLSLNLAPGMSSLVLKFIRLTVWPGGARLPGCLSSLVCQFICFPVWLPAVRMSLVPLN